ncbi:MAG: aminopeptidase P N-terminal domain-containing protein [bacterium]
MKRKTTLILAPLYCLIFTFGAETFATNSIEIYKARRAAVLDKMASNSVLILKAAPVERRNGDVDYVYRQDSDFYYLTGFEEPEAVLILSKRGLFLRDNFQRVNELLLLRERDPRRETWDGYMLGVDRAESVLGVQAARSIDELKTYMASSIRNADTVYVKIGRVDFDSPLNEELDFIKKARERLLDFAVVDPNVFFVPMRQKKDEHELELLKKAIEITGQGHLEAMRTAKPDIFEYQLEASLEYVFHQNGCEREGFPSIVGSGPNSCILHYNTNRRKMRDGEVVVLDIGAEYGMYTADITRTIPVSGKFTKEQKAIYNIVLEAQEAGIAAAVAGAGFRAPNMAAAQKVRDGLIRLKLLNENADRRAMRDFLPHGISHYIGLDVHDVGGHGILQPNEVITVEPGIYISETTGKKHDLPKGYWNIGVRIEDDILITENGPVLLSKHAPRKAEEIEKVMAGK